MEQEIKIVNVEDLSQVEDNVLNHQQLQMVMRTTPKEYVKERPAKGGGKWSYVSVGYVTKALNLMFGWDWDFEVIKDNMDMVLMGTANESVVLGKLTCRVTNPKTGKVRTIVKTQYGNHDVKYKNETRKDDKGKVIMDGKYPKNFKSIIPLSIGNDMKAAASDALKKCASSIGVAADIYNASEFRAIKVEQKNSNETEELSRVKAWINEAKNLEELRQTESYVNDTSTPENGLRELYDKKEKSL